MSPVMGILAMNDIKIASYWEESDNNTIKCGLCPHYCKIAENQTGKCGVRINQNGVLIASGYGCVTSVALDPIEKKPLYMFKPGKKIVSIGSYGCNFNCRFCQNYQISKEYDAVETKRLTPEIITETAILAKMDENIGIAYTYNEPIIGYEFIYDCSLMIREAGLANVLVTNGYINEEPLSKLLPNIDALNIDIKGYSDRTYNMVGGTLEPVKNAIKMANVVCHVEVTTLLIPDENENDVEEIAKWLSTIDPDIPYHLSRFFPRHKYSNKKQTSQEAMYTAFNTAKKHLNNVFLGNM